MNINQQLVDALRAALPLITEAVSAAQTPAMREDAIKRRDIVAAHLAAYDAQQAAAPAGEHVVTRAAFWNADGNMVCEATGAAAQRAYNAKNAITGHVAAPAGDHTAEPWSNESEYIVGPHHLIARVYGPNNARRIVACVNACKGLSTEQLEDMDAGMLAHTWQFAMGDNT